MNSEAITMNRSNTPWSSLGGRLGAVRAALGALALGAAGAASAQVNSLPGGPGVRQLNLHEPVTRIAAEIHWLHWFMLIICGVIFVGVFGVMFYSILKHRRSLGAKPANFHESTTVEIIWTVVPFIIVIGMALPATKVVVAMKDTTNPDLTIKATGYQWQWGYDYLHGEGEGINFISTLDQSHWELSRAGAPRGDMPDDYLLRVDNPLVVPVNKKIRIITTANDVIHAWMVPSFGVKQDAIPGFVRDTWFRAEREGDFYGQCAELCGKGHAYMPIHVRVVSDEAYSAWVKEQHERMAAAADDPNKQWALDEILVRGERVYASNCVACHQAGGQGAGPIKALDGSPLVLAHDRAPLINVMLNGAGGGAMPAWNQLSDTDIAAVTSYIKNSWSNSTGVVVQPADIAAARN